MMWDLMIGTLSTNYLLHNVNRYRICFKSVKEHALEYNITFPSIEKTGRKPCSIREHIIGIVIVWERDFDNVTCVWSCNVYAL